MRSLPPSFLPTVGAGVDASTLTPANVKLIKNSDGSQVPANRNTSGGGDVIVLQPTVLLDPTMEYRIEIQGVKDTSGAAFLPFSSSFVTGTTPIAGGGGTVSLQKVALSTATGKQFTSLALGPDGKLYAAVIDGQIYLFSLNADGTTELLRLSPAYKQQMKGTKVVNWFGLRSQFNGE